MLRTGLEQLYEAHDVVDEDAEALRGLEGHHERIGGAMRDARRFIRTLRTKEKREELAMLAALAVFYTVAVYVVWARLPFRQLLTRSLSAAGRVTLSSFGWYGATTAPPLGGAHHRRDVLLPAVRQQQHPESAGLAVDETPTMMTSSQDAPPPGVVSTSFVRIDGGDSEEHEDSFVGVGACSGPDALATCETSPPMPGAPEEEEDATTLDSGGPLDASGLASIQTDEL
mmetsp:Transcript_17630/g.70794  ORF Transcript_17630/g.70794 Transcript_17630/m.70794 type:complete len:228 (+) Transcript_17630:212-895(+)